MNDKLETLALIGHHQIAKKGISQKLPQKASATVDYNQARVVAKAPVITETIPIGLAIYIESFKETKTQRRDDFLTIITAFLIGLIGAATAAFAMGIRSSRQIKKLVVASGRIAGGDLATYKMERLEEEGDTSLAAFFSTRFFQFGEIRTLANSFRSMAAALGRIVRKLTETSHSVSSTVKDTWGPPRAMTALGAA